MIAIIYAAAVIGGYSAFVLTGGISGIGRDVGISGAWILSLIVQFLYATLLTVGFLSFFLLTFKVAVLAPSTLSVAVTSLLVSGFLNLYGKLDLGPVVEASMGAVIVIGGSAILFLVLSFNLQ